MEERLRALFGMFYPLSGPEQRRWSDILSLPDDAYHRALEREANARGLKQRVLDGAVAWVTEEGRQLLLLFRVKDPQDLEAVRRVYDTIARNEAPLAYTFVNQVPDGAGTWDIFHMSRLSYLAHCNRVSGPGSDSED